MVRSYLLTLKIINIAVYVWLLLIFLLSIFNFDAVITTADNQFVIFAFFGAIRNIFSYLIYFGGLAIGYACSYINPALSSFVLTFFKKFLLSWLPIDETHVNQFLGTPINDLHELGFINGSADPGAVYRTLRHLDEHGFLKSDWDTSLSLLHR